jgi:hypothetical protein
LPRSLSLRSGVSISGRPPCPSDSGDGKVAQTPRLGDFGVAALRKSTAVVSQTLYVTEPSGLGRAHEVLIVFEVRIRHVQPTALGFEY